MRINFYFQIKHIITLLLLFISTTNGILPGGSGTKVRHNTQRTHITQNNTPHSNKKQHAKLHKQ
jgi:hypothetical protein